MDRRRCGGSIYLIETVGAPWPAARLQSLNRYESLENHQAVRRDESSCGWQGTRLPAAGIAVILTTVQVAVGFHDDSTSQCQRQTAVLADDVLPGVGLEDGDVFEREHRSYRFFAVFLDALSDELVGAVDALAS